MYIGVKLIKDDDTYSQRVYYYETDFELIVGQIVVVPVVHGYTNAVVVELDLTEDDVREIIGDMVDMLNIKKIEFIANMFRTEEEINE